jgi:hypothetical protein
MINFLVLTAVPSEARTDGKPKKTRVSIPRREGASVGRCPNGSEEKRGAVTGGGY